ncbi:hypothetical protein D9X30_4909 [Cupriavidus sp. U2]|uniref:hypothetical protein n=1 Tax=Cupriavidus sp. U2 TaxID=2920269 RepID=UPI00129E2CC4|nr:hypothetical protein [Cupriavidus sp. U2]KAI3589326.1 hypothetical protein D9X30_4909 [Cupriavidus sp. U2]
MRAYILNRLQEPSTWQSLALVAGLFGMKPELTHAIEGAGVAVGGLLAVLLPG